MFNWILLYVVYYLLGAALGAAGVVAVYWLELPGVLRWAGWLFLLAWLFGYHALVIRWQYRSLRRLVLQVRNHLRGGRRLTPDELTELVMNLGGDRLGVPGFLVNYVVRRFYRPGPAAH
jgi:hypothetical protein